MSQTFRNQFFFPQENTKFNDSFAIVYCFSKQQS
jgi:hypothetical protein